MKGKKDMVSGCEANQSGWEVILEMMEKEKDKLEKEKASVLRCGLILEQKRKQKRSVGTASQISENDKYRYQGAEFQFIGFDELTQFSEAQYTYLFSRLRFSQENNHERR